MFTPKNLCAATALCLLPMGAYAGSVELSGGLAASLYFDKDLDHTSETVEGYVEAAYGGLYGGIWIGSLDDPADDVEYDLYIGYAGDVNDNFSYDVYVTGYWGDDSGYWTYDVTTDLTYAFSDSVAATYELIWDPDADTFDNSIAVEFAVNDKWTITPLVGIDGADDTYGELSFLYGLTDEVSFEVLFEDSESASPMITFTAYYDFSIAG
ncbi:hypothetical protein SAMN06265173_10478 [Thalassovita litoralis]|jgi:hypothetical protein|uniref:Uncharacterized protein n=1 Tax=Thalassovita litoralis TaxID=1010611 RepID=A0A521BTD6_9RHOB|nr:hypothetical protein [Thalassovita litoralis]SMO50399.1 hypothetical protein SAMN06265173_10478 [Thalassovita litoralis]